MSKQFFRRLSKFNDNVERYRLSDEEYHNAVIQYMSQVYCHGSDEIKICFEGVVLRNYGKIYRYSFGGFSYMIAKYPVSDKIFLEELSRRGYKGIIYRGMVTGL